MTVSANVGGEMSVGNIVLTAFQMAGLLEASQTPSAFDRALARRLFEAMMDGLQATNVFARAVTFENVTLTAADYTYNLAASSLDVFGDAAYIAPGETVSAANSESVVAQISRNDWQTISAKAATGTPSLYYAHRVTSPIEVRLWPIPDAAGTVRFQVHRKLADVDDDNATMDLEVYWTEWAIWGLAYRLAVAKQMPADRVSRLAAQAKELHASAKSLAGERTGSQFVLNHGYTS